MDFSQAIGRQINCEKWSRAGGVTASGFWYKRDTKNYYTLFGMDYGRDQA